MFLIATLLSGCGLSALKGSKKEENTDTTDSRAAFQDLMEENSDVFAWLKIPDTNIDYPLLQSGDGDDDFYKTHNAQKQEDPNGALYIECANMRDMCDFNEVVHGSSRDKNRMFGQLSNFLDRKFFDEHQYIYVYMEDNALIYCVIAAYERENTRLISQYDFSYASGCQKFIDEICDGRRMNKNIRDGWDEGLSPEHFLITLTTVEESNPEGQIVVVGCLVGDIAGKVDRVVDWSEPEDY